MVRVEKFKAAILTELNKELVIDKVTLPEELLAGQVLVKVIYSGICGSQLGEIRGVKGPDRYLPHLLGHEGVGKVVESGPGVKYVRAGDTVVMHWRKGPGIEAPAPVYQWRGKRVNAGFVTTFNEYAVVSENRLTAISSDFDLEVAPLFGCALTTGFGVAVNDAKIKIGESIVVFGAGGVGVNVIQAAAMSSAYPIIAVDIFDNKLELARKFGATHTVNGRDSGLKENIEGIVGSGGVDVAIDCTGNTGIIELAYGMTKADGRVVLVGVPLKSDNISIHSLPLHFGKVLRGSHGGDARPEADIPRYIKLYEAGVLKLKGLITDSFSLDQINVAIENLQNGKIAGRCLIRVES